MSSWNEIFAEDKLIRRDHCIAASVSGRVAMDCTCGIDEIEACLLGMRSFQKTRCTVEDRSVYLTYWSI